ncbi:MAG: hypothetical protein IIC01_11280 [Planctomycetes bacterium]|nr:hypothetical protein [Planctomycetota bacterium]
MQRCHTKRISAITDRRRSGLDPAEVVAELNRVLRGWAGYFCLGPVSDTYCSDSDLATFLRSEPRP